MTESKVVVVTGAGAGIGRSIARHLAAEGYAICVADRDENTAKSVAAELTSEGRLRFTSRPDATVNSDSGVVLPGPWRSVRDAARAWSDSDERLREPVRRHGRRRGAPCIACVSTSTAGRSTPCSRRRAVDARRWFRRRAVGSRRSPGR